MKTTPTTGGDTATAALELPPPVHFRAMLDEAQRPQQSQERLHDVGFVSRQSAENWIAEQADFKGWRYTLDPLLSESESRRAFEAATRALRSQITKLAFENAGLQVLVENGRAVVDELRAITKSCEDWQARARKTREEAAALRRELEALRAQEPYAWFWWHGSDQGVLTARQDYETHKAQYTDMRFVPVYEHPASPIDMVLHCPACGKQHIDAPSLLQVVLDEAGHEKSWINPPHRSHLCHGCSHIWRPADVPTNGVAAVKTKGNADSPIAASAVPAQRAELASACKTPDACQVGCEGHCLSSLEAAMSRPTIPRPHDTNTYAASSEPAGTASARQDDDTEDMAAVGRALMETLKTNADSLKGWHPNNCPSEIVVDLINARDDALASTPSTAAAPRVDESLPTIKGASLSGGYVIVTPAGWGDDKAVKVRDAILAAFPVDPTFTPKPGAAMQRATQDDGKGEQR